MLAVDILATNSNWEQTCIKLSRKTNCYMYMCNQISLLTNISTLSNDAKTVRMKAIKCTPLKADPGYKEEGSIALPSPT